MNRHSRALLSLLVLPAALAAGCAPRQAAPETETQQAEVGPVIAVYKSPTCGCCTAWEDHLRANGFRVESHALTNVDQVKRQQNVPQALGSCHTAVVEGYTVEGHVPADVIRRLLAERPAIDGIAVPGMPMGSPGMEGPYKEPYEIFTFADGVPRAVYETR